MWVELLTPTEARSSPMINIKPPPPDPFEIRCIVWGVKNVVIKDTFTEQVPSLCPSRPSATPLFSHARYLSC
jgi:hypothetical protein